jgi:DNA-binding NarL/FixJ family response regulator
MSSSISSRGSPRTGDDEPTPRETEVLALVAQGLTNREVAGRLGLSVRTVNAHLFALYKKLGVSSRMHAVREAERRGLLLPPLTAEP